MTSTTTLSHSLPSTANIVRETLDNGITVLIYENHNAQSVVITGSVQAGAIHESPEQNGLASLTVNALMRGTQHRDFETIHSDLEDIGADMGYSSGTHRIGFSGKALAEDLNVLLDVLADTLRYPTFPQNEVERLRGERLTWLNYRQQDTRWLAARSFRQTLYPADHPYHYSPRGTMQTIPEITLDAIRDFHERHYGPQGMVLVIVGAVQADDVLRLVRDNLGDWTNSNQPEMPALPPLTTPTERQRQFVAVPGKTQSDLMIGTIGPSRFDADYHAANIANSILGQFGMMGRVGDVVREQEGMAYYAYSRLDGGYGPGAWSITAGVSPANVERAIELCIDEIRKLISEPVTEEELGDNQSYFTGRLPLYLESNDGIAGTLHSMEVFDLGLDYLVDYHEMVYKLTANDLLHAAQRYLNPDPLVIAIAGPES